MCASYSFCVFPKKFHKWQKEKSQNKLFVTLFCSHSDVIYWFITCILNFILLFLEEGRLVLCFICGGYTVCDWLGCKTDDWGFSFGLGILGVVLGKRFALVKYEVTPSRLIDLNSIMLIFLSQHEAQSKHLHILYIQISKSSFASAIVKSQS